ncbi:hypothetical protein V5O48_009060 [Marasmius crinis-equi]|uniref:Uncharacterized protein n=1 Tax=Marasmius crinis-equi TaxID=585013 RepID=A0ABR3FC38_9AGAR
MPGSRTAYIPLPSEWFPQNPPLSLSVFSDLEKVVVRKEVKQKIMRAIERLAKTQLVVDRRTGWEHRWSGWRISLGIYNWRNVGRIFRKCMSLQCWKRRRSCIKQGRYMTRPLRPERLEELNDLRAFYDALGTHWSTSITKSDEEERQRWVRLMWQEREHPTLDSLRQIFFRHLDVQDVEDSEGFETDSTESEEGSQDKVEPDSDEDADWFGQMEPEESDQEMMENREVDVEVEVKVENP